MNFRLEKANTVIQKNLASIMYELSDPRLKGKLVSIAGVSISPDLKYAKVFVSIYGDGDKSGAFDAIKKANGYIKRELSRRIQYRNLPELDFRLSESEDYSEKIDKILENIKDKDKKD